MTVKELHELTGQLLAEHALTEVAINKESFYSPYENDGDNILDVHKGTIQTIEVKAFEGEGEGDDGYPEYFLVLEGE